MISGAKDHTFHTRMKEYDIGPRKETKEHKQWNQEISYSNSKHIAYI